jgi:hypothetical protein
MFKNRFLLVLGVVSILVVSLSLVSFRTNASRPNREAASDFYQRHPNWTGSSSAPAAVYSDYYERHPELTIPSVIGSGASDYYERHPELSTAAKSSVDTTDYYFRHPELSGTSDRNIDLTDYYFRHINNRSLP